MTMIPPEAAPMREDVTQVTQAKELLWEIQTDNLAAPLLGKLTLKEREALVSVMLNFGNAALTLAHPAATQGEEGEVQRLRAAITQALQCPRHIGAKYVGISGMTYRSVIQYDCCDPWEILCAALAPAAIASGRDGAE